MLVFMLILRQASFVLVSTDAFVSTDNRISSIGTMPGTTRSMNMCTLEVLNYIVDLIHRECVVSMVVGSVTCVRPSLQVNLYVVITIVVEVLNGMDSTNVTSMAGTETSVLIIIIDADCSMAPCDITVVINVNLNTLDMVMASNVTIRPACDLVTS